MPSGEREAVREEERKGLSRARERGGGLWAVERASQGGRAAGDPVRSKGVGAVRTGGSGGTEGSGDG